MKQNIYLNKTSAAALGNQVAIGDLDSVRNGYVNVVVERLGAHTTEIDVRTAEVTTPHYARYRVLQMIVWRIYLEVEDTYAVFPLVTCRIRECKCRPTEADRRNNHYQACH